MVQPHKYLILFAAHTLLTHTVFPYVEIWASEPLATKLYQHPSFPQTKHNEEHNTVGSHFNIFEMALGLI